MTVIHRFILTVEGVDVTIVVTDKGAYVMAPGITTIKRPTTAEACEAMYEAFKAKKGEK